MKETIDTLGMHFFLRCFRLIMVMTGLCPPTTGNPCDLVHNALKCVGPVYTEHFLVLLSVVSDINFLPSNSEEIRNAVELHTGPLLQQCSSKEKHFFMQLLISLKTVKKQKCALLLTSITRPLWGIVFWTMKAFFALVTMSCTCLMLREPDRWICHRVSTQFFYFQLWKSLLQSRTPLLCQYQRSLTWVLQGPQKIHKECLLSLLLFIMKTH